MAYIELTAKQSQGAKIQYRKLRRVKPRRNISLRSKARRRKVPRRKPLQTKPLNDIYNVYLKQEGCDIDRAVEVLNRRFS